MAKIIKVGSQNLTPHKIANPFKTSRNSTTNPFKYSNFEGNTLPFELAADVFQTKETNKLRMIASSVTGSMNKMRSSIAEPIINFVNRVRGGISHAWDYAKNTNVSDLPYIKNMNENMARLGESFNHHIEFLNTDVKDLAIVRSLHERMSKMGEGIHSRMEFLNTDVTEIGKSMMDKWTSLISRVPHRRYTAETPVEELESAWREIIALEGGNA